MNWLSQRGIRFKMTLIVIIGTLAASAVIVVVTAFAMQASMERAIADDLAEELDEAQAAVELGNINGAVHLDGTDVLQVIGPDGTLVASSPNAHNLSSIIDALDTDSETVHVPTLRLRSRDQDESNPPADGGPFIEASQVLGSGPFLVMRRTVESPIGELSLVVMTSLAPALRAAEMAARLLLVVMAGLILVVAFAGWMLTGRTLRPVEEMRANVADINEGDLSMRVAIPEHDPDLAPLAVTFNDLLGRIQASVDVQKRFISDASHELKSPVAATGVILEAMREYPKALDMGQAISDLSNENERMERIIGNMLVLARQDEGRTAVEFAPTDLLDVIHEEAARVSGEGKPVLDLREVQPVVCTTDRELLSHVLRNLLDNASRYARTTVKVTCKENDETVSITVSDDGQGISPANRNRAFERFVRLEEGDARRKDSTGLGLSVVKGSVELLGGEVRFVDPELGGTTAIVELPLVPTTGGII